MREKLQLLVSSVKLCYRRGEPQNIRYVKQRATGNHVASITPGVQNQTPSVYQQRSTAEGPASDGSLLQGVAETHPKKHLLGLTRTQGQASLRRCNPMHQHLAGTQTRHAFIPPWAGLESRLSIFNIFNCSQSRAGCKKGVSPCSLLFPQCSACAQSLSRHNEPPRAKRTPSLQQHCQYTAETRYPSASVSREHSEGGEYICWDL